MPSRTIDTYMTVVADLPAMRALSVKLGSCCYVQSTDSIYMYGLGGSWIEISDQNSPSPSEPESENKVEVGAPRVLRIQKRED